MCSCSAPPPISPHPRWYSGRGDTGRARDTRRAVAAEAATAWIRVVSIASARVIAGRMVVTAGASIRRPAPGGRARAQLWQNACIGFTIVMASKAWGQSSYMPPTRSSVQGQDSFPQQRFGSDSRLVKFLRTIMAPRSRRRFRHTAAIGKPICDGSSSYRSEEDLLHETIDVRAFLC